ncbi:MAG: acyl-CoA dehydrogenase family protein [Polyangiaceae bacterium]
MTTEKAAPRIALSTDDLGIFFQAHHQAIAARLREVLSGQPFSRPEDPETVAYEMGGRLGLYAHLIPGDDGRMDVRTLVLIREALGQVSPLGDAIFAVQGLGSYPIVMAGTPAQKERYLHEVAGGIRIGAFGLTEPEAGSDVASMRTVAKKDGDGWILDGEKTLISNVPIANHYVVFANADPSAGRKGITAFVVEKGTEGLDLQPIPMSAPHPLGRIFLRSCRVPDSARLGDVGRGFGIALATLDTFRISVGAAANGMAWRALKLAIDHVKRRVQFGKPLADQQIVQAMLADMATELDAARLLVLRAAHKKDTDPAGARGSGVEVAMAKMFATEGAQHVIDKAVQLHGGLGVTLETEVEHLYREIRPLRIYEGTTEIQKLIIARALLDAAS